MSYRLIDANALNGVISNDDYEKVLNAPCVFADLPNGLDGEHYNLQEPVLDKISDEVNKLKKVSDGNKVYVGINDVFNIIDKYRGGE